MTVRKRLDAVRVPEVNGAVISAYDPKDRSGPVTFDHELRRCINQQQVAVVQCMYIVRITELQIPWKCRCAELLDDFSASRNFDDP
jgi:hypothetical protein